ncbi:MAG: DinB family protein [Bacteroidota bacterium]
MIHRPTPSEYAPFYAGYVAAVEGDEVAIEGALVTQMDETEALLKSLDPDHRYAPGKWTVREVVQHMIDCERAFAFRALWWARGSTDPLPGFDQDVWMEHAPLPEMKDLLDELLLTRTATTGFFTRLPASAWDRGGLASGHHITVRAAFWVVLGHMAHHTRILRERYRG